jgi:peptidyl-prolyl cis-trans isomerase SurA
MKHVPAFLPALQRHLIGIMVAVSALAALPATAEAQLVAVVVNGDPITNFDVEQRIKLIQISTHKAPARKDVIEELIDEKLKIQLLRRYNIPDIDKDVESAFANMARRMRTTPREFTAQLERSGLKVETLKSRMKAELIWSQIIRGRYQSSFQFSDKDIEARIETKKPEDAATVGYDYTLRPILFLVPRGSPATSFEARKKEAEAFRSQFNSCAQGIPLARGMRYVAVRPQILKGSAELPPAQRDILAKVEVGHLTPPEVIQDGVQVYAVCGKRQSDNAPAKKEARDQLYNEKFSSLSKNFLKELRSQAMIEYR